MVDVGSLRTFGPTVNGYRYSHRHSCTFRHITWVIATAFPHRAQDAGVASEFCEGDTGCQVLYFPCTVENCREDRMAISVFLSYPRPFMQVQQDFIDQLCTFLNSRGLEPRTLGVTDYDMDAPLKAIRRLMLESNGLITVALRRTFISSGTSRMGGDLAAGSNESKIDNTWLTSPYCHIEPAMAYQIGLPILFLREQGVIEDGLLGKGVVGSYMPEFDLTKPVDAYFRSPELNQMIGRWEGYVRAVVEAKGNPPRLY